MAFGNDMRIGDEVMVVGRSHAARETIPVDLNGRWPSGEDGGAGITGVTVEIHQNVDAVARDGGCCGVVRQAGDIGPAVHGGADA